LKDTRKRVLKTLDVDVDNWEELARDRLTRRQEL